MHIERSALPVVSKNLTVSFAARFGSTRACLEFEAGCIPTAADAAVAAAGKGSRTPRSANLARKRGDAKNARNERCGGVQSRFRPCTPIASFRDPSCFRVFARGSRSCAPPRSTTTFRPPCRPLELATVSWGRASHQCPPLRHFKDAPMLLLFALLQAPVRQVTLTTPDMVLAESFSQLRGVRELRNGKVLLVDRLDRGLLSADFATGTVTKIGKEGRGPLEYTLLSGLIPLGGDSTLAYDEGNGRLVLVTPDLHIARTFTLLLPGLGLPVGARGVDREGRYYLRIPAWMFRDDFRRDTLPIVRFDLARARVDTIAFAKGSTARPAVEHRVMGVPYVIFAAEDGWAVAPDGRIAVVRSGDYHVEWYTTGRPMVRGPAIPFTRRRVSAADRFAYIKRFIGNSATSGRDATGGGGLSAGPALSDAELQVITDAGDFAEFH